MKTARRFWALAFAFGLISAGAACRSEGQAPAEKPGLPPAEQAAPVPVAEPTPAPVTPPKTFYEGLEISVSRKAENNGTISLEFLPQGGTARAISVNVLAKTKAKDINRDLGKELTLAAGTAYKVKVKSDSIKIKKATNKSQNLWVGLAGQTVNGVSILVQKD